MAFIKKVLVYFFSWYPQINHYSPSTAEISTATAACRDLFPRLKLLTPMGVDLLLKILENVVPTGVIVLVGIGLFFMRDLYERNLKYLREERLDLKDFYEKRINDLRIDLNELKEENKYLREEARKSTEREIEARLNFVSLIKDFPGIHSAVKSIFQSLKDSVNTLSFEQGESKEIVVRSLQSEIEALQSSVQDIARVDERTKNWLNQVEELSVNRKEWASEAEKYALERARQRHNEVQTRKS